MFEETFVIVSKYMYYIILAMARIRIHFHLLILYHGIIPQSPSAHATLVIFLSGASACANFE